jgi:putative hemolysin
MPTSSTLEILVIFLLILANGIFAMAEIALISARKARLRQMSEDGDRRARLALDLAESPTRFLSAVQVGITLAGVLAGALGGVTLAETLAVWLGQFPLIAAYREPISIGLVVLPITYLSLVIGELVPKRIALNHAEQIAAFLAPLMKTVSSLASPAVTLLSHSTDVILRVIGIKPTGEPPVTEEEVRILIELGMHHGVFEPREKEIVDRVFRLGDRRVESLMIPRHDIHWLDINWPMEEMCRRIASSGHSRFPLAAGSLDEVTGIIKAKDLLVLQARGGAVDLQSLMAPALFVPEGTPALKLLERFKEARSQCALVVDEHGGTQGLVTLTDVLEAIIGEMPQADEPAEPETIQRADGSWLLDGGLAIHEFEALFQLQQEIAEAEGDFQSLGGLVMAVLGRVPVAGDNFEWNGLRLEVVDMDGRRVDKVLAARISPLPEKK